MEDKKQKIKKRKKSKKEKTRKQAVAELSQAHVQFKLGEDLYMIGQKIEQEFKRRKPDYILSESWS